MLISGLFFFFIPVLHQLITDSAKDLVAICTQKRLNTCVTKTCLS